MTPKERVITAINHQQPDRVPINYSCNPEIDKRLKEHYGLKQNDDEGLRKILGVDFRQTRAFYNGPRLHPEQQGLDIDPAWGIQTRWVENESGGYRDYCGWPLRSATLEEIEAWPMPSPDDYDYSKIPEFCERFKDYCLITNVEGYGDIINSTAWLRGMEQVLCDLMLDDPAGLRLIDRRHEIQLEVLRRILEAGKFDMVWLAEDLGSQHAPMISMELFKRHIRPRLQKFVDVAKERNLPIMFHSCGSSSWAFGELIDMGIEVIQTLQPEAKDMSPDYLKKEFGDKLAFHGCISTAGPLAYGSVDDVIKNVRDTLDIMMPGGGYCLAPTHAIQDNSPTENVIAMYQEALSYGVYK